MRAMWRMMQQDYPDVYVIVTGESHSVREFVEMEWKREGTEKMVSQMVRADLEKASRDQLCKESGFKMPEVKE